MIPAARLALAVELLQQIETGPGAADQHVGSFFRARRFAGAKDRNRITELVYAILRRQAELAWRIAGCGGEAGPRALVLAGSVLLDGLSPEQVSALCSGDGFAPPMLQPDERRLLDCLAASPGADPPDWVRGGYPEWLDGELRRRFGSDIVAEMQALQDRAPVDLRVNALYGTREDAIAALAAIGVAAEPCRISPVGIRLAGRARLGPQAVFQAGLVEPQDEGSQVAALLVGAAPGMQVVDLCAGAGGKTLAMAAGMANKGQIYACDRDGGRLKRLAGRVQRAGVRNVQSHRLHGPDPLLAALSGKADRVLLDVPCSGTGTWRRQPEARWRLTPEALRRDLALQDELLRQGAGLVQPGGRLVYVTCSLLPAENEDRIAAFLDSGPGFRLLPVAEAWAETLPGPCPADTACLQLTPRRHGTDGFFAAVLRREA